MASIYLNLGMTFEATGEAYTVVPEEQLIPGTHEYLFHFLDADLNRLERYVQTYLSCLASDADPDEAALQRIYEELFALHPYFRARPANTSELINKSFANYINATPVLTQKLQAMEKVCVSKYIYQKNSAYWLELSTGYSADHIFEELFKLQRNLRQWVFLSLDNTNPDMAKLSGNQRNAVYSLLYGNSYIPMLEYKVEKRTAFPQSMRLLSSKLDFSDGLYETIMEEFSEMQKMPYTTPATVNTLIQAVSQISVDCEYHTYIIDSLEDILKFEVYNMTQAEKRIKRCKNCGKYFIVDKGNVEYCDRIAAGETKPCSEIGKTRTYEKRVADGGTAMALYRKAYKTHFARIRAGKMTKDQFDSWKDEATAKRQLTETGRMGIDEYSAWLKK